MDVRLRGVAATASQPSLVGQLVVMRRREAADPAEARVIHERRLACWTLSAPI